MKIRRGFIFCTLILIFSLIFVSGLESERGKYFCDKLNSEGEIVESVCYYEKAIDEEKVNAEYDSEGRLVEFKTPTKETIFEYDSDGNLLFGRKKNLLTGNIESSLEYEYDNGILISGNVFVGGQNYIYEKESELFKLKCRGG